MANVLEYDSYDEEPDRRTWFKDQDGKVVQWDPHIGGWTVSAPGLGGTKLRWTQVVNYTRDPLIIQQEPPSTSFVTKDSGERVEFSTGMRRDVNAGKPRFDLIIPKDVPWDHQLLVRVAGLMARGAEKYDDRNWEKASTAEEKDRFKESAFRHFMQWYFGQTDEDHGAAVVFNIQGADMVDWKEGTN